MTVARSRVVLMVRVDDPILQQTLTTRSTIVTVEHFEGDELPEVVEMALELAPPVTEWGKY